MFSGVPKAGAPERMSTLEVKAPYMTGAPGRTSCVSTTPNSASAFCCASAPASVTGAHRAHQRERRDDDRLAVLGHRHQPLGHRLVEAARRVDRDDRGDAGIVAHLVERQAARDRHHLDAVQRPAPRRSPRHGSLVGQRQIGEVGVEMARIGRQFDRRADLVAEHVDAVEMLRQPDEVAVVAIVAGAAAAFHVVDIGRPGDQGEIDRVAAEVDASRRIARRQLIARTRRLQRLRDHARGRGGRSARR